MYSNQEILELVSEAQALHAIKPNLTPQSVAIIGKLEDERVARRLGMSVADFARHINLNRDQYVKRSHAARILNKFPRARAMLDSGETSISNLTMVYAKITQANENLVFDGIRGKSKRETAEFLARVTFQGQLLAAAETVELRLILTQNQMRLLDLAREVLAAEGEHCTLVDTLNRAVVDLLAKRDHLRRPEPDQPPATCGHH